MASAPLEDPTPSTPLASNPLHVTGIFDWNAIHVQGSAGKVQFSGTLEICQQQNTHQLYIPGTSAVKIASPESSRISSVNLFSHSTEPEISHEQERDDQIIGTIPSTPIDRTSHPIELSNSVLPDFNDTPGNVTSEKCDSNRVAIVTRLRSGAISPVTYSARGRKGSGVPLFESSNSARGNLRFPRKLSAKRSKRSRGNMLERVLRRHSYPIRPCNSYTFFVMAKWDVAKSSSFGETSKRLKDMWWKLPQRKKKAFVDMALKDNERYKEQCMLLSRRK